MISCHHRFLLTSFFEHNTYHFCFVIPHRLFALPMRRTARRSAPFFNLSQIWCENRPKMAHRVAVLRPFPCPPRRPAAFRLTQSQKDLERTRARRRAAGAIFHAFVANLKIWLQGEVTMVRLLALSQAVATSKGQRIDRHSKRTKEGLICWLCETAPELAIGCGGQIGMPAMPAQGESTALPTVAWPTLQVEAQRDETERAEWDDKPHMQFPRLAEDLGS
jgi:hypothetical protein